MKEAVYRKREAKKLELDEIIAVVKDCILQGRIYDDCMNEALFGERPPLWWGEWPDDAKKTWDMGAQIFLELMPVRDNKSKVDATTREDIWRAIDLSSKHRNENMRLTWRDIGRYLGIGSRDAMNACKNHKFELVGVNTARELFRAPCITCGEVQDAYELSGDHKCQKCFRKSMIKTG